MDQAVPRYTNHSLHQRTPWHREATETEAGYYMTLCGKTLRTPVWSSSHRPDDKAKLCAACEAAVTA